MHSLCSDNPYFAGTPNFVNCLPYPGPPTGAAQLHIHEYGDPRRVEVQRYIHRRYAQRYDADITEWLPTLASLQVDGEIVAAAGYRSGHSRLFLEHYLRTPIEHYLGSDANPASRSLIVEAGQFAAMRPGAGRLLVPLIAHHLRTEGFQWVVSTVTRELHHLLERMGLRPNTLAAARLSHLPEKDRAAWGSYYDHEPHVVAGRLAQIIVNLECSGK